jgi:hypothetical protein
MKYLLALISLVSIVFLSACTTGKVPTPTTQTTLPETAIPAGHFYFSAPNCVACANVASFITSNKVKQRMYYIELSIDSNGTNVDLLTAISTRCGIPQKDISVPLFWDGQRCYQGTDEVISYFNQTLQ